LTPVAASRKKAWLEALPVQNAAADVGPAETVAVVDALGEEDAFGVGETDGFGVGSGVKVAPGVPVVLTFGVGVT
jgi:hypothetical protein